MYVMISSADPIIAYGIINQSIVKGLLWQAGRLKFGKS